MPFKPFKAWSLLLLMLAAAVQAGTSYSFSPANQRSPLLTAQYWNPILDYVSRRSHVELELQFARTGAQSSDDTVHGKYDFVYNNHQFKPSAEAQGYSVILRPRASDITGQIVTLDNSSIHSLRELTGKTVGFANPEGFTGYTVQMDYLMRQHIQVTPTFGGSQQGIMMQLMSGNVIAAGVNSTIMREFADQQHLRYRVLWESPPYHDLAISAHARVPKAVIMAVQKAFAGMSEDAEGMKILENSARVIKQTPPYGFLPASQQDYQAYLSFYRHAVFQGAN